jgi:hypothetical protein
MFDAGAVSPTLTSARPSAVVASHLPSPDAPSRAACPGTLVEGSVVMQHAADEEGNRLGILEVRPEMPSSDRPMNATRDDQSLHRLAHQAS